MPTLRPFGEGRTGSLSTWSRTGYFASNARQFRCAGKRERVAATVPVAVRPAPAEAQLKEYEGNYSFSRTLGLRVYALGSQNHGPGYRPSAAGSRVVQERYLRH